MSKCLKFGWYLPYTPNKRENGSWKHHYIMCTYSLDMEAPSRNLVSQYIENFINRFKTYVGFEMPPDYFYRDS